MTNPYAHLASYASQKDEEIDIGALALDIIAPDHDGISVDRYTQHLEKIKIEVGLRHRELLSKGSTDDLRTRLAALKFVLSDTFDYRIAEAGTEPKESADIMRVIDLAVGIPAAIAVLYMDAARAHGWAIEGINFPGIFLCRMEKEGERLIFAPSKQCKIMEARELRDIVKNALGQEAELSNSYFDGLSARASVVNLYNHIKLRYIEMNDYESALDMVLRLRTIAPEEYRLLLDAGVLYARLKETAQARQSLNAYIEQAASPEERYEAELLLKTLGEG